ncbi:hypothetical protein ACFV5G_37320, partial [Streptomyces sp. NPDC059766]|uniref:hypothetical protein n=1 Tax=Streptomyces sp. NPDC059766 TaxID=3346940 RepID=UPI003668A162
MRIEYLRHGVPLADYQLTKADHRRQQNARHHHPASTGTLTPAPNRTPLGLPIGADQEHVGCVDAHEVNRVRAMLA